MELRTARVACGAVGAGTETGSMLVTLDNDGAPAQGAGMHPAVAFAGVDYRQAPAA